MFRIRPAVALLLGLLSGSLLLGASAQGMPTLRDASSVRAAGMGGAARGFASSGEALLINPAGIAATARFNVDLGAVFAPPTSSHLLGASAIDSKLNAEDAFALGGGAGYWHYQSGNGEAQRKGSLIVLGLAAPLVPQTLFLGVAGRYLTLSGAVSSKAVTGDVGLLYKPVPSLGLAAVGYNLIDVHSAEAPRAWGFGLALGRDADLHLDFDVRIDKDAQGGWKPEFQVGAEYLIGGVVEPRVGYVEDRLLGTRTLAMGLTLQYGGLALDASYQKTLQTEGWAFGLALRLLESPL
jgi:hypothetical protein